MQDLVEQFWADDGASPCLSMQFRPKAFNALDVLVLAPESLAERPRLPRDQQRL